MSKLRILLVEPDPSESQRISSVLLGDHHAVIPTSGLDEASEALLIQKFDAVLLGSVLAAHNVSGFTAQLRHGDNKTPVLSCSGCVPDKGPNGTVDGYLPQNFEATAFANLIQNLLENVSDNGPRASETTDLPLLEVEEFKAQVAYDDDLMVEIIDLFLAERTDQISEMRTALAAEDYDQIARVAHTIKGSLGSLHAIAAKFHAQELEFAAKRKDASVCRSSLAALESDLSALQPLLLSLRVTASSR